MAKMVLIEEEKLKQALEALESYKGFIDDAHVIEGQWHWIDGADKAITVLCEALAQPQQEPLTDEQSLRIYNGATHAASIAVFMTRMDAEAPDADDKGVSGWLQEAEERIKRRITEAAHGIDAAEPAPDSEQDRSTPEKSSDPSL